MSPPTSTRRRTRWIVLGLILAVVLAVIIYMLAYTGGGSGGGNGNGLYLVAALPMDLLRRTLTRER